MKPEDFKLIPFIQLNPIGSLAAQGKPVRNEEGGHYNGYVAVPEEYAKFLQKDGDQYVSMSYDNYNLPGVHGGCTYLCHTYDIKEHIANAIVCPGCRAYVTNERYVIFGFDTLHYCDTMEMWPPENVMKEAENWAKLIANYLSMAYSANELNEVATINTDFLFGLLSQWNVEEETGYKPVSTFWEDFSIADLFVLNGSEPNAVLDTHKRSWPQLTSGMLGVKYLTEYVMVLNHKIWQHHNKHDDLAKIYQDLYYQTSDWAYEHLKDEELRYFIDTLD